MGLGLLYTGLILKPGQEILTTVHDHYSTEMSLRYRAQRTGATVRRIPLYRTLSSVSQDEIADAVAAAVTPQTRIVAVTWVHSSTGLKLPVGRIAERLHAINASRAEDDRALLCVDGVHGLGAEAVSLPELGCDFFIAGTHKWMFGPRGTGLVWGREAAWQAVIPTIPTFDETAYGIWMRTVPEQPLPPSAVMTPGGFHSFEHRWALAEAFRFHDTIGKPRVTARIHELNRRLKEGLRRMPGVTLITPLDAALSAGITCLDLAGWKPEQAVARLRERRIVASVTPYAEQHLRVAPSLVTSPADVDRVIEEIRLLARA
jgi:selenocysteine lyase/cysteine desulfurase